MSLLDEAMEEFYMMNKTKTPDGYGGFSTTWTQAQTPFKAAIVYNQTLAAKVAEKQGVTSVYTITTPKNMVLEYHDVLKRKSDNKIFRVTSDGDDSFTPASANLNMRQVTAEEWELIE